MSKNKKKCNRIDKKTIEKLVNQTEKVLKIQEAIYHEYGHLNGELINNMARHHYASSHIERLEQSRKGQREQMNFLTEHVSSLQARIAKQEDRGLLSKAIRLIKNIGGFLNGTTNTTRLHNNKQNTKFRQS